MEVAGPLGTPLGVAQRKREIHYINSYSDDFSEAAEGRIKDVLEELLFYLGKASLRRGLLRNIKELVT